MSSKMASDVRLMPGSGLNNCACVASNLYLMLDQGGTPAHMRHSEIDVQSSICHPQQEDDCNALQTSSRVNNN